MRKIFLKPFSAQGNDYTELLRSELERFGDVLPLTRKACLFEAVRLKRDSIIILGWFENGVLDSNGAPSFFRLLFRLIAIVYLRIFVGRVIFIRHNNYPHATKYNVSRAKFFVDILEMASSRSIVHCPEIKKKNRRYVPHPLYFSERIVGTRNDYFIFFGRISRYKEIDVLMREFPTTKKLMIAGIVDDEAYVDELSVLIKENIILMPGMLDKNQARELVSNSAGLIVPNSGDDMIVSGSFFFGISCGVPVYAVNSPFFSWIEQQAPSLCVIADDIKMLCHKISLANSFYTFDIYDDAHRLFGEKAFVEGLTRVIKF